MSKKTPAMTQDEYALAGDDYCPFCGEHTAEPVGSMKSEYDRRVEKMHCASPTCGRKWTATFLLIGYDEEEG